MLRKGCLLGEQVPPASRALKAGDGRLQRRAADRSAHYLVDHEPSWTVTSPVLIA